ncbi:MAG: hypothetical protein EOO36_16645, partial [Cytophagaceae bacterium]
MKHVFASLLLTGTLASAAQQAAAQTAVTPTATATALGTLTGTVADSVSRQPLAFATVVLRPTADAKNALSTVTTDKGGFSFANLAAGPYTLEVHYLGYRAPQPVAVTVGAGAPPVALA